MNKKILLLLALVAALALVFVACEENTPVETTPGTENVTDATTEAPTEENTTEATTDATTEDATTEEVTTEEVTTEEETTEEVTTEEVTTEPVPTVDPYIVDLSAQPVIGAYSGYRTNEENPGGQFGHINSKNNNEIANNGGAFMFFDEGSVLTLNFMDLSQYNKVTLRVATGTQDSLILSFNVDGAEVANAEMRVVGANHLIHEITFDLSSIDATDATVTLTVNTVGICPGIISQIVFS